MVLFPWSPPPPKTSATAYPPALISAYKAAVATITTILTYFLIREKWQWHLAAILGVIALFLNSDISFFAANMMKLGEGGWFPLAAGIVVFTMMSTWRRGRELLARHLFSDERRLEEFLDELADNPPHRIPGTAVFMTGRSSGVPPMLRRHIAHNQSLHEQVLLLTVLTGEIPRMSAAVRLEVQHHSQGFARGIVHYGFMQSPNIPVALRQCEPYGLNVNLEKTTFYLSR